MEEESIAEFCQSDPNSSKEEQEFSVSFTKDSEKASICSTISSQCKRLLKHSDVDVTQISTVNTDEKFYQDMSPDEFEGGDDIVVWGVRGEVPIESLKIQSTPRGTRSYAQIISPQNEVNFNDE